MLPGFETSRAWGYVVLSKFNSKELFIHYPHFFTISGDFSDLSNLEGGEYFFYFVIFHNDCKIEWIQQSMIPVLSTPVQYVLCTQFYNRFWVCVLIWI
jgi:hypothetical protein